MRVAARCHGPASRSFGRGCKYRTRWTGRVSPRRKLVEAAGIERGRLDDLGAVSPRYLAQVRAPPREMGGPRALSRVANRHTADSVDIGDHGGPDMIPISLNAMQRTRLARRPR